MGRGVGRDGADAEFDIATAARLLGTTTGALRKRAQRGSIPAQRTADGWRFVLPTADADGGADAGRTRGATGETEPSASWPARVAALEAEIVWLRSTVEREQAALQREQAASAELRRLLAMQSPPQLPPAPAPVARAEMPESAPAGPAAPLTPSAPQRGFWARLLGRQAGRAPGVRAAG